MDEAMRIPKETIDILKDQVFGFDTFFVTSQEPYEVSRLLEWLSMSCCLQFPCIKYYMWRWHNLHSLQPGLETLFFLSL